MNYIALTQIDMGKDGFKNIGDSVSNCTEQLIVSMAVIPSDVYNRIISVAQDKMNEGKLADVAFTEAKSQVMPGYTFELAQEKEAARLEAGTPSFQSDFVPESLIMHKSKATKSTTQERRENKLKEPNDKEALSTMKGPMGSSDIQNSESGNTAVKK